MNGEQKRRVEAIRARERANVSAWMRGKKLVYMKDRRAEIQNEILEQLATELDSIVGWTTPSCPASKEASHAE
jgi:hypothetical protein